MSQSVFQIQSGVHEIPGFQTLEGSLNTIRQTPLFYPNANFVFFADMWFNLRGDPHYPKLSDNVKFQIYTAACSSLINGSIVSYSSFGHLTREELIVFFRILNSYYQQLDPGVLTTSRLPVLHLLYTVENAIHALCQKNAQTRLEIVSLLEQQGDARLSRLLGELRETNPDFIEMVQDLQNYVQEVPSGEEHFSRISLARLLKDAYLTNQETLRFSNKQISRLPQSIGKLTKLKVLDVNNNHLTGLPDTIKGLVSLKELVIAANRLAQFPIEVLDLEELKRLDVSHNMLRVLPDEIEKLNKLEALCLSFNFLRTLPNSLVRLEHLQELQVSTNQISTLPSSREFAVFLRGRPNLDFSNNRSASALQLTVNVPQLPQRTSLLGRVQARLFESVTHPYLERIRIVGLSHLPFALRDLDAWATETVQAPEFIFRTLAAEAIRECFRNQSQVLDLSDMFLTSLPNCIGELIHLVTLNVSRNRLDSFPRSFASLRNLQILRASDNYLMDISSICSVSSLEEVHLERNQIYQVPNEITHLDQARIINLNANHIIMIPTHIQSFLSSHGGEYENAEGFLVPVELDGEQWFLQENDAHMLFTFDEAFMNCLTRRDQSNVKFYIHRLLGSVVFVDNPTKKEIIKEKLYAIFKDATRNQEFRGALMKLIKDAVGNCDDRALEYFGKIEICWFLHCKVKSSTTASIASTLIALTRIHLIEEVAEKKSRQIGWREEGVEIALYYQISISGLNLPISVQEMHYESTVESKLYEMSSLGQDLERSIDLAQVKRFVLDQTSSREDVIAILMDSDVWIGRMEEENGAYLQRELQSLREELESDIASLQSPEAALSAVQAEISALERLGQEDFSSSRLTTLRKKEKEVKHLIEAPLSEMEILQRAKDLEVPYESKKRELIREITAKWVFANGFITVSI